MLRIEQGFDPSVFKTDDPNLKSYVKHHRHVAPVLSSPDLWSPDEKMKTLAERYMEVIEGLQRSATLILALQDLESVPGNRNWQTLKSLTKIDNTSPVDKWKVRHAEDSDYHIQPEFNIWTAKRTLTRINDEVSIKERYTIAGHKELPDSEYEELIESGRTDRNMLIATASVYVVNRTVELPQLSRPKDINKDDYPILYAFEHRIR